jgi:hypothetical protein
VQVGIGFAKATAHRIPEESSPTRGAIAAAGAMKNEQAHGRAYAQLFRGIEIGLMRFGDCRHEPTAPVRHVATDREVS